jgi:hypothetical protein
LFSPTSASSLSPCWWQAKPATNHIIPLVMTCNQPARSVGGTREGRVEARIELIHAIGAALDGRIYVSEDVG